MSSFAEYEKMAMLELSSAQRDVLEKRFHEVSEGFSALDSYDVSGILPLVTVLERHNVMREDTSSKPISRDELLKNAAEQRNADELSDGYFRVPAAIE